MKIYISRSMSLPNLKINRVYKEGMLADLVDEHALIEVSELLSIPVQSLNFVYNEVPINDMLGAITELRAKYKDVPKDTRIVRSIAQAIRMNKSTYPVLVNADNSILEGHHRIVAMYNVGIKTIPVLRIVK